jgi:predicted transcriptional regulator
MNETNSLQKLSRRERQIMDILIEHKECSAQDVLRYMPDPPSYSSVRALIARLVEKGHAQYRTEGNKHIYSSSISTAKAQDSALKRLVKTFFKGSGSNALTALLDMKDLDISAREIENIERKIARIKAKNRDRQDDSSSD